MATLTLAFTILLLVAATSAKLKCDSETEEEIQCGNDCELKCSTALKLVPCMAICSKPACACKAAFARNSTGTCVHVNECPEKELSKNCGDNEKLNGCGSRCENTCEEPKRSCPRICYPPACACEKGFFRHPSGSCVVFERCPVKKASDLKCDKEAEIVNQCGSRCEGTCEKPLVLCPRNCPGPPACYCKVGFLRNQEGKCVLEDACKTDLNMTLYQAVLPQFLLSPEQHVKGLNCSENEIKSGCGNLCEPKCKDALSKVRACPLICNPPACACKEEEGFVRNSEGVCVRISNCPRNELEAQCDEEKEFVNMCGNLCEGTCDVPHRICPRICRGPPTCTCNETRGYVRHENGSCVLLKQCPAKKNNATTKVEQQFSTDALDCKGNETVNGCGALCEDTCENVLIRGRPCPRICNPSACVCKKGFARNQAKVCVAVTDCPIDGFKCNKNEEVNKCGSNCEKNCEDLKRPCPKSCPGPDCVCKNGFARLNNFCVKESEC